MGATTTSTGPHWARADRAIIDTGAVVLVWAFAWLGVRLLGDDNVAVAGLYVLPVAMAGLRFGWSAGALTAIASALFAGPLSPALSSPITDAEILTFTGIFLTAAAGTEVVRRSAPAEPAADAPTDSFGGVARELHTPVQAIRGALAMLDRLAPNDGEERVAVATLGRAADQLHDLETLLSAVGRELNTERRADDQTLVDLRLVAGDVAAELRKLGGLSRLRFDASHEADVVMGHQERIHLLLRCLVGDVLDATSEDEPVDCHVRRDLEDVVIRVCAPSDGTSMGGRIRLVAAQELATRLGGSFDAIDAGGAVQLTVRLPQRRLTDPALGDARRPAAKPAVNTEVWTSGGGASVWARVAG